MAACPAWPAEAVPGVAAAAVVLVSGMVATVEPLEVVRMVVVGQGPEDIASAARAAAASAAALESSASAAVALEIPAAHAAVTAPPAAVAAVIAAAVVAVAEIGTALVVVVAAVAVAATQESLEVTFQIHLVLEWPHLHRSQTVMVWKG